MTTITSTPWLSASDTARAIGVSKTQVFRLTSSGHLPSRMHDGRRQISAEAVIEYREEQRRAQTCPACTTRFHHQPGVTGSRCPECAAQERAAFRWSYTAAETAAAFPERAIA